MQNAIELRSVGSTNDYAKTMAREGCPHGSVVLAEEQTAGRGRQGNIWTSAKGNLFMSLVLRPRLDAASCGQLSFLAAVALAEVLREILPKTADIGLKWPNDVFLNGRKAAGILLEAEADGPGPISWVVIGIGVNILSAPEKAISLKDLGVVTTARALLDKLYDRIMILYNLWIDKGFEPLRESWSSYAMNIGKNIQVRLPKESFSGRFVGIDETGSLQLDMPDGTRKIIASGEVFL